MRCITRREALKASGVGAAAVGVALARCAAGQEPPQTAPVGCKQIDEYDPANTKVGHIVPPTVRDDDILFLQQIGLRSIIINFKPGEVTLDEIRNVQQRFARHNIQVFGAINHIYRSLRIQLGQAGRDEDIEQYLRFLRHLGSLGIRVAHYDFHPANTYTTAIVKNRGHTAREFSVEDFRAKVERQAFDREYAAEEIWANYIYFMKAVLPVAEEANVTLTLHPDDPPLAKMNGVAKLFTHYDGYRRAEEIAGPSRHWGLTFCVGTWSEGGDRMGKNVFEMIRDFGGRGKIFEIHFRNVTGPLPRFHETFPDDGYLDMYQVMKSLRQVKFNGALEPDHVPRLAGDTGIQRAGTAYCISYIRALLRRANEEVG